MIRTHRRWLLVSFLFFATSIFLLVKILKDPIHFGSSFSELITFYSLYLFCLLTGVTVLNIWATLTANAHSPKENIDGKFPVDFPWISDTGCKYCGSNKASLVCPDCNSIQWQITKGPKYSIASFAIFIAHYRWNVIIGLLTLGIVFPTTRVYTMYERKSREDREMRVRYSRNNEKTVLALNKLRSQIYLHENKLWVARKDGFDIDAFANAYYELSWYGESLIHYLSAEYCDTLSKKNIHTNKSKACCNLLDNHDPRPIAILDQLFLEYMRLKRQQLKANDFIVLRKNDLDRETLACAMAFYYYSKYLTCAIAEMSYNIEHYNEGMDDWITNSCSKNLREYYKEFKNEQRIHFIIDRLCVVKSDGTKVFVGTDELN